MSIDNSIGERIKALRSQLGINQEELGSRLGLTKSGISSFEKGKSKPSIDTARKMAAIFNVGVDYLLTDGPAEEAKNYSSPATIWQTKQEDLQLIGTYADLHTIMLPFVPVDAYATFTENCTSDMNNLNFERIPVHPEPGIDYSKALVIQIRNNSMAPNYRNGSRVIIRPVAEGMWQHVTGAHVVSTKENMLVIKRIVSNKGGVMVLRSDNTSFPEELQLQISDINCLWEVGETIYTPAEKHW
jgi:transcriptional regulator with XRE-family HTH domain